MFCDARNENKRPYWIGDHVWNDLLSHWNAPEYRSKCEKEKKNRASEKGGCMHIGGCISLQDHAIRLSQELGRSAYINEIFQQTHLRKDTGTFVDDRYRQTHENFEARLCQARSDVQSSVGDSEMTLLSPAEEQRLRSRCWIAAAGPMRKGCLYGTGDLAHSYKCGDETFVQNLHGSSSHAYESAEINQIKEELRQSKEELRQSKEALRQSTEQMRVFQTVVLQFLPPEARSIMQQQQQLADEQHQQHDQPHDAQQQNNDEPANDQQGHDDNDYVDY